jgi:hypothetical protein
MATGEPTDTRLHPGETKVITYDLPEGTAEIEAKLLYHLGPRPLLMAAGLEGDALTPSVITAKTVQVR